MLVIFFSLFVVVISRADNRCSEELFSRDESRDSLSSDCCQQLSEESRELKQLSYYSQESHVRQTLTAIVDSSEKNLDQMFGDQRISVHIHRLFSQIRAQVFHNKGRESLEDTIDSIFDYLFVNYWEKLKRKRFSKEYVTCLTTIWKDFNSFSSFAQTIATRVERAIDHSVILLRSVSLANHVLNLTTQCSQQVIQSYCSCLECHSKPSYCYSSDLDHLWKRFVSLFRQFTSTLVSDRNPETLFSQQLPQLLLESQTQLNSQLISQKVKLGCGSPRRYVRESDTQSVTSDPLAQSNSLFIELQTNSHQLSKSKDLFTSVSMRISCTNNTREEIKINLLSSKLLRMSQTLESRDQLFSDQGSGQWSVEDTLQDDEDYSDSGSASGDGESVIWTESPVSGSQCFRVCFSVLILLPVLII